MHEYRCKDGRVLRWRGVRAGVCTQCEVLFGSPAAFDKHIRRRNGTSVHDLSRVVWHAERERYVTALSDE